MPVFLAKVGTPSGTILEQEYTADSEAALRTALTQQDLHVFQVRRRNLFLTTLKGFGRRQSRVPSTPFLHFNQELVALLNAGLPLLRGLEILSERQRNETFRQSLERIHEEVKGGASLSEAFAAQGAYYPTIYPPALAAGERSGELPTMIQRYITHTRKAAALRKRVAAALVYPVVLMTLSVVLVFTLIYFIMPKFTEFYADFSTDLPGFTLLVVGTAEYIKSNSILIFLLLFGGLVGVKVWGATQAGRFRLDRWALRLPLYGVLRLKYLLAQFSRTLGTLLAGGIPLVSALGIVTDSVPNAVARRALEEVIARIREGGSLWESLEASEFQTDLAVEMIKVGESTGALDTMLHHVAEFYNEEIDGQLGTLMAFLEPAILVGMGLFIAGVLLALYLPVFRLGSIGA